MRNIDKTALLFEMLLGSDMNNVNRKIEEIRFSPAYIRVANFVPESSNTQLTADIKERFEALDIYSVLSMHRILEVEKEIKELYRRIILLPTINPYLSNSTEKKIGVQKVGQIGVVMSAEGKPLNDFTSQEGIEPHNRKNALKLKLFNWYKEAKKGLADSIDNSKLMISRIRKSKIHIKSIAFENILLILATLAFTVLALFSKKFADYRAGTLPQIKQLAITGVFYASYVLLAVSTLIVLHFKTYPKRTASKLRKQIVRQQKLVNVLDNKSYDFEKEVIHKAGGKKAFKLNAKIKRLAIMKKAECINSNELFEYVYCEKEYYIQHKKGLLVAHNIVFALALLALTAVCCFAILF